MMFTIDNTPRKSSYLKKGLNKLRSSTRKSPGQVQSQGQGSARRPQQNLGSRTAAAAASAAGRLGRASSSMTPLVVTKGTARNAKSPGLTASARKVSTCAQELRMHDSFSLDKSSVSEILIRFTCSSQVFLLNCVKR